MQKLTMEANETAELTTMLREQRSVSESMKNDAPRLFTEADMAIGDVVAQGDLYFMRISKLPNGGKSLGDAGRMDSDNSGTAGTDAHRLDGAVGLRADSPGALVKAIKKAGGVDVAEPYIGPMFRVEGQEAWVRHERASGSRHGDVGFSKGMCIATYYQRELDAAGNERRVMD